MSVGRQVYDNDGRRLGEVVGIAGRQGTVRAVMLRNDQRAIRLPVLKNALVNDRSRRPAARNGSRGRPL